MAYLTTERYRVLTLLPVEWLDEVESRAPGFTAARIAAIEALEIDSRLRKRYAIPFAAAPNAPVAIESWVTRILNWEVLQKRGIDAQDGQWEAWRDDATAARAELTEAANSETGLYDLPLRADKPESSGIVKGGPFAYSEASPYVFTDVQGRRGRDEDRNGGGTSL